MPVLRSLTLLILLNTSLVFSQQLLEIDSTIKKYENSKIRGDKFYFALSISEHYSNSLKFEQAKKYLNQATHLVDSSDNYEYANLLTTRGTYFFSNNQHDLMEKCIKKSLEVYNNKEHEDLTIENFSLLAMLYSRQSKVYLSNSYWFSCVAYYQKTDDIEGLSTAYNTIGFNYSLYGDFELSLHYFLKSYEIAEQQNDIDGISAACINVGWVYEMLGDNKSALEQYRKSLALHKELGVEEYIGYSYVMMGTMFAELDLIDSASYYLDLSSEILETQEDEYGLSYVHFGYSRLYDKLENHKKSEEHAKKAIEFSILSEYTDNELRALNQLHQSYYKLKKYKEAYNSFKAYVFLRDSLKNPLNSREIAGLEYKHEYQTMHFSDSLKFEEDKRISNLKHNEELKRYWIYAVAGIIFVFLLVILILVLIRNSKVRKKKNQELRSKNLKIQEQKKNIELAHYELEVKNGEILDSIIYAKRIQSAILPPNKVVKEFLHESFILYKPKDIVAGDFYWLENKNGYVLFAAADCTGHGVPGAMVSVVCNNGLNRSVREFGLTDPGKILDNTRDVVIQEFEKSEEDVQDGMDIALCALKGDQLLYAGANNPLWIIRKGSNEVIEIKADKQPIGKFRHSEPFTTHAIDLNKGDTIYIFSDGYADQFGGEKGKKFKTSNFKELLLSIQPHSIEQQKELIDATFENWKGSLEQLDDVCVIGVRI